MEYVKEPLSLEDQADRLLARGLIANRDELIGRLRYVNYYRLSGYLHPFRINGSDHYRAGTSLAMVWRRYCFDRRLRVLLMDAIERIEVAVRTRFVHRFVMRYGAFGHLQKQNLPNLKTRKKRKRLRQKLWDLARLRGWTPCPHREWLRKLRVEKGRSGEKFVRHFNETYGDSHRDLHLWGACELMTCETLQQFANGVPDDLFREVAADFGFVDEQLRSWMKAIFSARNACAHHSRLLNREVGASPLIPRKKREPLWHQTPTFERKRIGLVLTVSYVWLGRITASSGWRQRLVDLFAEYPEIPLKDLGMPAGWQQHPLWQ